MRGATCQECGTLVIPYAFNTSDMFRCACKLYNFSTTAIFRVMDFPSFRVANRYGRMVVESTYPRGFAVIPLARLIAECVLGRQLVEDEVAHHIDHDKTNDTPENIAVMSRSAHTKHHASAK